MGDDIQELEKEKAIELGLEDNANRRAAATPLPGPLSDAFLTDAIDCGNGLVVRRIVASDWIILQWLDSPLYKMALEAQKDESIKEEVDYQESEGYEMIWQFTHTPKQCRELKAKGREAFTETAYSEIGDAHKPQDLAKAIQAIGKQIAASFETKVSFEAEDSKKK